MSKKDLTEQERKLLNQLQYKARGTARNTLYKRNARLKQKQRAQSQPANVSSQRKNNRTSPAV